MENKLYVGNLSYNATDEDLRELFEQAGTVKSVTVMRDRDTGRSRARTAPTDECGASL